MRGEDESLGISDGVSTQGNATPIAKDVDLSPGIEVSALEVDDVDMAPSAPSKSVAKTPQCTKEVSSQDVDVLESSKNTDSDEDHDRENIKLHPASQGSVDEDSEVELERELDKLFLDTGGTKKESIQFKEGKPKIGAAKAKRQKKAEKQAVLEAEGKLPPKPLKNRKPYDPSAAMQKARGETVATGRRNTKKKS